MFLSQRRRAIRCQRCSGTMDEIMEIEALWDQPGLVAFECPDCEYLASVIVTLRQRLCAAEYKDSRSGIECHDR